MQAWESTHGVHISSSELEPVRIRSKQLKSMRLSNGHRGNKLLAVAQFRSSRTRKHEKKKIEK